MSFLRPQTKTERITFVSVIGVTVLIVFGTLFSILLSTPSTKEQYLAIAQRQEEIVRIAKIGQDTSRTRETTSIAVTARSTISSSQRLIVQAIEQGGEKVNNNELRARENSQTTTRLSTARQANRFDQVFKEVLAQEISAYQEALEQAYNKSNSNNTRTMLQKMYAEADVLLETISREAEQ